MSHKLDPIPREVISETHTWRDWFFKLQQKGAVLPAPTGVTSSGALTEDQTTAIVTTSGLTLTLPKCTNALVGTSWRVNLSVAGTCLVQVTSTDTIMTVGSASDTSVLLNLRGMTLEFLCATADTWVII